MNIGKIESTPIFRKIGIDVNNDFFKSWDVSVNGNQSVLSASVTWDKAENKLTVEASEYASGSGRYTTMDFYAVLNKTTGLFDVYVMREEDEDADVNELFDELYSYL